MILTLSIGNDQTKVGIAQGTKLLETWSLTTTDALTADEAEALLYSFFSVVEKRGTYRFDQPPVFEGSIIASVVPSLTDAWIQTCSALCKRRPLLVGPGLKTKISMRYNDPSEIGADRIANMVAARILFESPLIVIDMGTTTNFSVLDTEGAFCGGIIAPGLRMSAQALTQGAAQLFDINLKAPTATIGKTTQEALRSGVILGEVARLEGLIQSIWQELGYETKVIATGPDAQNIAPLTKSIHHVEANLTLFGLANLYEYKAR